MKLEKELIELRHKYKMEELATERENNKLKHDFEMEIIRVKSAEIRKNHERQEFNRYAGAK